MLMTHAYFGWRRFGALLFGLLLSGTLQAAPLAVAPTLRSVAPTDLIAYLRLPSLWGVMAAPNGNFLEAALRHPQMEATLAQLKAGSHQELLPLLTESGSPLLVRLLAELNAPFELIVLPPAQAGALPRIVASTTLNTTDPAAVNGWLQRLVAGLEGVAITQPLNAAGQGLMMVTLFPVKLQLQPAEGRLLFLFDLTPDLTLPLPAWLHTPQSAPSHPLHQVEQSLDQSGQGALLWFEPRRLLQSLEQFGLMEQVAMLRALGLSEASSLALGLGTVEGKGRLRLDLKMAEVGMRLLLPSVTTTLSLPLAGEADGLAVFGLPTPAIFTRSEQAALQLMEPPAVESYKQTKAELQQQLGLTIEELLAAVGDDAITVSDQAGIYLALKVRSRPLYQQLLQRLTTQKGYRYQQQSVHGQSYHHLQIPASSLPKAEGGANLPLVQRLAELPDHLYWSESGDYLIFGMPHTLIDYHALAKGATVAEWLQKQQRLEANHALLLATTRNQGVPQLLYSSYLWVLQLWGDLVKQPVNLFNLPTPQQLKLPQAGSYSLQLSSSGDGLALELLFESHPFELLMAGGASSLLTTGLIASIAIPAFNSYEAANSEGSSPPPQTDPKTDPPKKGRAALPNHAEVQQSLKPLRQLEQRIDAFEVEKGRYPNESEAVQLVQQLALPKSGRLQVKIEAESGTLYATIRLGKEPKAVESLVLWPADPEGWACEGSLDSRYYQELAICDE